MKVAAGKAVPISLDFSRHWTPVHLDIHVEDIERANDRKSDRGGRKIGGPTETIARQPNRSFGQRSGCGSDMRNEDAFVRRTNLAALVSAMLEQSGAGRISAPSC